MTRLVVLIAFGLWACDEETKGSAAGAPCRQSSDCEDGLACRVGQLMQAQSVEVEACLEGCAGVCDPASEDWLPCYDCSFRCGSCVDVCAVTCGDNAACTDACRGNCADWTADQVGGAGGADGAGDGAGGGAGAPGDGSQCGTICADLCEGESDGCVPACTAECERAMEGPHGVCVAIAPVEQPDMATQPAEHATLGSEPPPPQGSCAQLFSCREACTDDMCIDQCITATSPAALVEFNALWDCLVESGGDFSACTAANLACRYPDPRGFNACGRLEACMDRCESNTCRHDCVRDASEQGWTRYLELQQCLADKGDETACSAEVRSCRQ